MASSLFARMLRVKIAEVLDTRSKELAGGICSDYSRYMHEVGYIQGLKDALTFSEDIEREPDERSDTA